MSPNRNQPQRPNEERMPLEQRKAPVAAKTPPPEPGPPSPQPDEPERSNDTEVVTPPAEENPDGGLEHYDDPDEVPVIADQPEGRQFAREHGERLARQQATYKPEAGVDWDDPAFLAERDTWAAEVSRLSRQRPVSDPKQATADDLPTRKVAPPVRQVRPETFDQQTPNYAGIPPFHGAGMPESPKVQVVATDPSVIQTMRPAGEVAQGNVQMHDALDIIPGLRDLIAAEVSRRVAASLPGAEPPKTNAVFMQNPNRPAWTPDTYLVHFRNDTTPSKRYMRMTVDEDGDRLLQDERRKGEWIHFQNGHYFATTEDEVAQLKWAMTHPAVHPHTGVTVGGDPAIYIDDDSPDVMFCPECRAPFASRTKLDAHRKATHNAA